MLLPRAEHAGSPQAGALCPWPAVLVTWGPGGRSALHAHHCWHLIVALDGPLSVRASSRGPARVGRALLTRPDVAHAVDASGRQVVIVFVEPESETGGRLASAAAADVTVFSASEAASLVELCRPVTAGAALDQAAITRALDTLGAGGAPARPRHPGIRRVLRHLRTATADSDASLAGLAARARLSAGRFMHAFTESVGVPLRPYLRWLKLERAGAAIASGVPLAAAAAEAGFADAAHMSRTFRRMFGVTPSELRRHSQSVQDR
jgi:AraC-like DNA-binding protein